MAILGGILFGWFRAHIYLEARNLLRLDDLSPHCPCLSPLRCRLRPVPSDILKTVPTGAERIAASNSAFL
jgi:hypothetical protein